MFTKAKITKLNKHKNEQGVVEKIHITGEIEDTRTPDKKQFDIWLWGQKLKDILDLPTKLEKKMAIKNFLKEVVKRNHKDWVKDLDKATETTETFENKELLDDEGNPNGEVVDTITPEIGFNEINEI